MRRLLAAVIVLAAAGVQSAQAAPILELSLNSAFSGGSAQTMMLTQQAGGGVAWNGFTVHLGPVSLSNGGLYITVSAASISDGGPQTIWVRTTSSGPNGSPFSNVFSLRFQTFNPWRPPSTILPVVTRPGYNGPSDPGPRNPYAPPPVNGGLPLAPVPEPASLLLFGSGLAAAAAAGRRHLRRRS